MAYFSLHAYDADVWVRGFRGLAQWDQTLNPDINYAAEAENVETPDGVLQPEAAMEVQYGELANKIETLSSFYRRWYKGIGSKEWMVAAANGKLYFRQADVDANWTGMDLPIGISFFQNNIWSTVTYEITENNVTVDVLLISNADDGMYMIVPPDRPANWADKAEHDWTWVKGYTWEQTKSARWVVRTINTQGKKFGVITRYSDRIWGGNIEGEPDMLMYSAPYDPTDWTLNVSIPEDGAGDIMQPSWDGTSFTALEPFGDQLIAFKQSRVWRVIGTNPGEYEFREQYGGGAPYNRTIASDGERIFMVDDDGLSVYDGMTVTPYKRENVEQIWRTVNHKAINQMAAAVFRQRYYLAFPVGDSTVNNAMLVYNFHDGTVLYYSDIYIESFMATTDDLYATSSSLPGKLLKVMYDSWATGKGRGTATKWVSPWIDFGYKRIQKGGFELYFLPEVQEEPVTLSISIQTEKKTKTKKYTVQPLNVISEGKPWSTTRPDKWGSVTGSYIWGVLGGRTDIIVRQYKHKKLHFSGSGRRFRIIIETEDGVTAPWRLIGGLQMVVETDPD